MPILTGRKMDNVSIGGKVSVLAHPKITNIRVAQNINIFTNIFSTPLLNVLRGR